MSVGFESDQVMDVGCGCYGMHARLVVPSKLGIIKSGCVSVPGGCFWVPV